MTVEALDPFAAWVTESLKPQLAEVLSVELSHGGASLATVLLHLQLEEGMFSEVSEVLSAAEHLLKMFLYDDELADLRNKRVGTKLKANALIHVIVEANDKVTNFPSGPTV